MLKKIELIPGIDREGTDYSAEGGWYDSDKIRFRKGRPEKIGGWTQPSSGTVDGVCRALHNWSSLNSDDYLGLGTTSKVYVELGGTYYDITPSRFSHVTETTAAFNDSATTFNVLSNPGPVITTRWAVKVGNEFMKVSGTGGTDNKTITVTRAEFSSTAVEHFLGDAVYGFPPMTAAVESSLGLFGALNGSSTVLCRMDANGAYPGDYVTVLETNSLFEGGSTASGKLLAGPHKVTRRIDTNNFEIEVDGLSGVTGETTLLTTIEASATSMNSVSGGFGAAGIATNAIVKMGQEYIKIGNVSSDAASSMTRGYFGTTAERYLAGEKIDRLDLTCTNGGAATTSNWLLFHIRSGAYDAVSASGWSAGYFGESAWNSAEETAEAERLRLWSIDNWGEDLVISPRDGPPYVWDKSLKTSNAIPVRTGTAAATDISGDLQNAQATLLSGEGVGGDYDSGGDSGHGYVPSQIRVMMIDPAMKVIIAFGSSRLDDVFDPMLVRWSDIDKPGSWYPTSINSAGGHVLGHGSYIIGAARSKREMLVWTDAATYVMRVNNSESDGASLFIFQEISNDVSVVGPKAYVEAGNSIYWMGDRNFYSYDGSVSILPCTVLDYVYSDLNYTQKEKIFLGNNAEFNEVIYFYPSAGAEEVDRYVIYNYVENAWSLGSLQRTAWSNSGIRDKPVAAHISTSSEEVRTSVIYAHEDGHDDLGSAMNSYVTSGYFDIDDGDNFAFISRMIPDVRFDSESGNPGVSMDITVMKKDFPNDLEESSPSVSEVSADTSQADVRVRGRQVSVKFSTSGGGYGWRLGDVRIDVKPDGRR